MFRRLYRVAFYAGLVLVIALSVMPQDAMPTTGMWDKINHALAYAALALAGGLGFLGLRAMILVALGLLLLGAGLELVQSVLPDRTASLYDLLANAVGIVLGSLVAAGSNSLWPRPRRPSG
jgi:VanZ family protein